MDPRVYKTARKSAPAWTSGVNVRRLVAARAAQQKEQEEQRTPVQEQRTLCSNPFCRKELSNRYAKFCEDGAMCQRYRALKLQCLANAQAQDEEDERPLSSFRRKKTVKEKEKEREESKEEEIFAIPKKKLNTKRRRQEEVITASPRRKKLVKKKKEDGKGESRKKKRLRRARELEENGGISSSSTSNNASAETSPASSADEIDLTVERGKKQRPRIQRALSETLEINRGAEGKTGPGSGVTTRPKRRRLTRRTSANTALSRSASSSPTAAAPATDASWTIPRSRQARHRTAAQAIKRMGVELVPLGAGNPTMGLAGGGRYVQSGNRTAVQSMNIYDPRPRQPSMIKFAMPKTAVSTANNNAPSTAAARNSSLGPTSVPPRYTQATAMQSSIPAPQAPPPPPPLPPLPPQAPPPQAPFQPPLPPPQVPRPMEPARTVTPSSSPARLPGARSAITLNMPTPLQPNTAARTTAAVTGAKAVKRISSSDYLKQMKDRERYSGARRDLEPPRAPSLGRSSSLTDERNSGFQPPAGASSSHGYSTRPPDYYQGDSAPLPPASSNSINFRSREFHDADPRRQSSKADEQFRRQRPPSTNDRGRMFQSRGEYMGNVMDAQGQREDRNIPPPRDYYPPRPQPPPSFDDSDGYEYAPDVHFSPPSSSHPTQSYRRELSRDKPQHPPCTVQHSTSTVQRPPSTVQRLPSTMQRPGSPRSSNSDDDVLDEDTPIFSYHESFTSGLLTIFVDKFPRALEAIFNVTKKPRKMNWYIKYVERIERLCKPYDLRVKFEGLKAAVMVRGRAWSTLKGKSTVTLHEEIIKSLYYEALTWLQLKEAAEGALVHYRGIYRDNADMSFTFLRAWNDLKRQGNLSVARQANYFCGARLHHWNFVIGKVEIGSGSHEDKREAFRLATVSALDFLLSLGRYRRRPDSGVREIPQTARSLDPAQPNARERQESPSHKLPADNRVHESPPGEQAGTTSATPSSPVPGEVSDIPAGSSGPVPSGPEQPNSTEGVSTNYSSHVEIRGRESPPSERTDTADPPSSPVERPNKPDVIPNSDSSSSHDNNNRETVEHSDSGENMSISDASDVGDSTGSKSTPASSAPTRPAVVPTAQSIEPDAAPKAASPVVEASVASPVTSATASPEAVPPVTKPASTTPANAPKKVVTESRRCMMCEMIRMRNPDAERCLRCQQNEAEARHVPST